MELCWSGCWTHAVPGSTAQHYGVHGRTRGSNHLEPSLVFHFPISCARGPDPHGPPVLPPPQQPSRRGERSMVPRWSGCWTYVAFAKPNSWTLRRRYTEPGPDSKLARARDRKATPPVCDWTDRNAQLQERESATCYPVRLRTGSHVPRPAQQFNTAHSAGCFGEGGGDSFVRYRLSQAEDVSSSITVGQQGAMCNALPPSRACAILTIQSRAGRSAFSFRGYRGKKCPTVDATMPTFELGRRDTSIARSDSFPHDARTSAAEWPTDFLRQTPAHRRPATAGPGSIDWPPTKQSLDAWRRREPPHRR